MNQKDILQYVVLTSALELGFNDKALSAFLKAIALDIDQRLTVKEAERILQQAPNTKGSPV